MNRPRLGRRLEIDGGVKVPILAYLNRRTQADAGRRCLRQFQIQEFLFTAAGSADLTIAAGDNELGTRQTRHWLKHRIA